MKKTEAKKGMEVALSGGRTGIINKINGNKAKVGIYGESGQWRQIADLTKKDEEVK